MTGPGGEQGPQSLAREALDQYEEYQRTGDLPLLTRAVDKLRAAVAAAARNGAPDLAVYHNNLAYALHELAAASADPAAQAESVSCYRAAVAATGADDLDRVPYLCSLASALRDLYGYTGEAELLQEAVRAAAEAVQLPGLEPSLATQYGILAGALGTRYEHQADPAVLTELIAAYRKAASCAELVDDPELASHWNSLGGWLCERYERTGDTDALTEAVRVTREAVAATPADDPARAQTAVSAGRPDRAAELLERTRGVLVADELDRRAGHDHQGPLTVRELSAIAVDGPVIYVYDGVLRCEALVLISAVDSAGAALVRHVQLSVTESEVWAKAERLMALAGLGPGDEADFADPAVEREVLGILGWLRERVTGPVLAAIGYDRVPAGECDRPRIWWCPVGAFAFLPLHAACLDEVVSSYAFTARSLRYARSQRPPRVGAASAPLIVAVPGTPDTPPLPAADREAKLIAGLFPDAFRLKRPTRKTVLAALPEHPVAHFACHGRVNPTSLDVASSS